MNDYLNEKIKALVAKNPGKFTENELFEEFFKYEAKTPEDMQSTGRDIKRLIEKEVFTLNASGKLVFQFGKPYKISTGKDFYGSLQEKLASKGYRWEESIFNDGSSADCMVRVTRDPDCFWNHIYSDPILSTGWGRFNRFECWSLISEWLIDGGFKG